MLSKYKMKTHLQIFKGLLFFTFIAILFSCTKNETLIGKNLIPGGDYINGIYTDTFSLKTKTVFEDSLPAKNNSRFLLGAISDDVFGKSFASIYTQLKLNTSAVSFNDTAYIDSCILSLRYSGNYYGDKQALHNIKVYKVNEDISSSDAVTYQSFQTFTHEATTIGQKLNFKVNLDSSFAESSEINSAALRIPISNIVAQDILNQTADGALKDNASFQAYFKGLYIEADTSFGFNKGMISLDLRSSQSTLTLYYHTPNTSGKIFKLTTTGSTNTNYFKHNFNNSIVKTAVSNTTDTTLYIQSMAGTKSKITIPHISNLGKVLINKAEIEVTQILNYNNIDTQYTAPASMVLLAADSLGKNSIIIDQLFSPTDGLPNYGGSKIIYTDASGTKYTKYKFSIAARLQQIINFDETDYGFYLLSFPSNQIADRIIVGGGNRNNDAYQMKLNLVYTKIP